MRALPPEDRPPPAPTEASEEDALAAFGELTPRNPAAVLLQFALALQQGPQPDLDILAEVVTPESLPNWGDFSLAREFLQGSAPASGLEVAPGDPQVVYGKFLTTDHHLISPGAALVMARAMASLVWRPEVDSWLVHAVGERVPPEDVPR